jgi:monoamine oxidase
MYTYVYMTEQSVVHDVVVVGGGLAGLTTAHRLREAGRDVVVVEAADRVGGRLLRQHVAGMPVDGGGAWVGPTQDRVLALIAELGLSTKPTYDDGRHVMRLRGKTRVRAGQLPPLNPLALADTMWAMHLLDRAARGLPRRAAELDRTTVGAWLDRHMRTHGGRTLLDIAVAAVAGSAAHDVSLLSFATQIRSAGGMQQLTGVRGAAQDARIVGGSLTLCERLVDRVGHDRVRLGSPVAAVEQNGQTAVVRLTAGRPSLVARDVVVALDPSGCVKVDFGPSLPAGRRTLHQRWTMGTGIKFHVAYPTPFWRGRGLSGQAMADDGLVRLVFDATSDPQGRGVLVGFLGEPFAEDFSLLAPHARAEREARVIADLTRFFGPDAAAPLDYVEQDWREERYLTGCVPAARPGVITSAGSDVLQPFGRVHWAGAETSDVWQGYMDGAVRSAERVVAEIA